MVLTYLDELDLNFLPISQDESSVLLFAIQERKTKEDAEMRREEEERWVVELVGQMEGQVIPGNVNERK